MTALIVRDYLFVCCITVRDYLFVCCMTALIRRNKKVVTYFSNLMVENKQAEALLSARKASTPRSSVSARTPRALEGLGELGPRASTFLPRPPGGGAANSKPSDMHAAIDRFVYIHVGLFTYMYV